MSDFRRSGSFVLSPKKTSNVGAFVTPSTRRQSFTRPTPTNSLVLLEGPTNNDEAERRERQLNRLQQLQSRAVSSPTGTPSDGRKSSTFAGLTNQQITDHYSKCIQLSAENKINIKNAFNLQLIDYMTELLKRKDSDMNNFQVASCTLDASSKIYGYRVDSVHTDTLKMAGGLGRTKDQPDNDGGGGFEEEEGGPTLKKKNRTKKCVTIETNLKNLNVAHFELEFDVDPLFKKTASQFDDGGAGGGQFLNTLQLLDDTCQLVLDSDTVIMNTMQMNEDKDVQMATIPPIPDCSKLISPTFEKFQFTSWKLSDDSTFCNFNKTNQENEHAFDMNAVPEPLDDLDDQDGEYVNDMPMDEEDMDDETVVTLGGGACRQEARGPAPPLEIVHLKDHLANKPLEYSYFDVKVMSAWAGPGHWRLKSLKGRVDSKASALKSKEKLKKLTLEYDQDSQIEEHFAVLQRATRLSKFTVKKWNTYNTTLPVDLHYDPAKLSKYQKKNSKLKKLLKFNKMIPFVTSQILKFRDSAVTLITSLRRNQPTTGLFKIKTSKFVTLYLRPSIVIRRQTEIAAQLNDSINDYNYDNTNDKENYCPDIDAGSNYGETSAPGCDDTDFFSQTMYPSQPTQNEVTKDFFGDNLVEAPNKISLINIGYARTAKKIDMKKLKVSLWNLLSDPDNNKENERMDYNVMKDKMDCNYRKEFSRLYSDLHPRLPKKMAQNLSVPLAFIALLHLANEHCLELSPLSVMGDFVISQG